MRLTSTAPSSPSAHGVQVSSTWLQRLVKLGSHALALAVMVSAAGCVVDSSDSPYVATNVLQSVIATNATLSATAGSGVGVFVEYSAGGHWTVFTACDTTTSGADCSFDITILPDSGGTWNVMGQSLDVGDNLTRYTDGSIELVAATSTGLNGVTFDATPGSSITVDLVLDGKSQPRFLYWKDTDVLHQGAPSNPMSLAPSAP